VCIRKVVLSPFDIFHSPFEGAGIFLRNQHKI
jgi:hypothetical protein